MRNLTILAIFFLTVNLFSQWQSVWVSNSIDYNTVAGWIGFEEDSDGWKSRFYTLDSNYFKIMTSHLSSTPAYTYTFTNAEKLAGFQLYSLSKDLTGDGITEFYVLGYYGSSSNYRQGFKIFDIVSGNVIFEKGDNSFSYSYPTLSDLDNNGNIECVFTKVTYPSWASYYAEVYTTTVTGTNSSDKPIRFELKQNFPNPFNPVTNISFEISQSQNVRLRIFDITGQTIKMLVNDFKDAGTHEIVWDGTNDSGIKQPTGIYFYELLTNEQNSTKKMLLLK